MQLNFKIQLGKKKQHRELLNYHKQTFIHCYLCTAPSCSRGSTLFLKQQSGGRPVKATHWEEKGRIGYVSCSYPTVEWTLKKYLNTPHECGVTLTLAVLFGWKVVVGFCCTSRIPSPASACSAPYRSALWPEGRTESRISGKYNLKLQHKLIQVCSYKPNE